MKKPSVNYLKIGQAAKALGISIDTLRRWEKNNKITAIRTPGGTRLYSIASLRKINPASVEDFQTKGFTTEELLKRTDKQILPSVILEGVSPIGSDYQDSIASLQNDKEEARNDNLKRSFVTKFLIGSAVLSVITLLMTSWITASYLTSPKETQQFFKNNVASGIFTPFHKLAEVAVAEISPEKAQELGFDVGHPGGSAATDRISLRKDSIGPPGLQNDNLTSSNVLAVTSTTPFLEVNSDTQINGSLFVRDAINGLSLEATPSAGTINLTAGTTALTITKTAKLDQDVSTAASPSFSAITLSSTTNQILSGANKFTLPGATTILVGTDTTQTLTNKSLSGSSNTFTNIPNSALTNSKVTVTAGTNLSGGGDVTLGSSITIALKDSPAVTSITTSGIVSLADGTAAAPALTFTSDTDTGLYRIGANKIGLITGGTATSGITIDSSGNVGIANNSPAYKLDVTGTANVTSTLTAQNGLTLTTGALSLTSTSGSAALTLSSGTAAFNVQSGLFDIDTQNSRVGIGTASPGSTLNVIGNVGIGTSAAGASLQVNGGGLFGWGTASVAGPSNGLAVAGNIGIGTTSPNNKLQVIGAGVIGADWGGYFGPSNGLLVQGNVGIGTSAPGYTLDVNGTARFAQTISLNSGASIFPLISGGSDLGTSALKFNNLYVNTINASSSTSTGQAVFTYQPASSAISEGSVYINPTTATSGRPLLSIAVGGTEKARITTDGYLGLGGANDPGTGFILNAGSIFNIGTNGNVGIGTSVPGSVLSVIGNVGIGTSAAGSRLAVNGNSVIGWGTASVVGPANGLAVSGNVGIGTTSPAGPLQIQAAGNTNVYLTSGVSNWSILNLGAPTATTTLDLQVGGATGSTDDAYPTGKTNGTFTGIDLATSWQQFGAGDADQYGAVQRFTGVTIPDGATISVAYLTLTGQSDAGQATPTGHIYAHDQAAPATYSTVADLNARPKTTAEVTWSNPPVSNPNVEYNTPSIVSIIQELMASYSYATGSSMGFVIYGTTPGGDSNRAYYSYNGSTTKAVKLHIEYTTTSPDRGRVAYSNSDNHLDLVVNSATAVTILSGGNVGIGTTTPSSKLNVIGNVGIGTSAAGSQLAVNGNGIFGWGTASVVGPTNGLAVFGNVGIGTTTANYNLSVVGTANITGAATFSSTGSFASTLSLANGSAATPALNFTNSTGSGLWYNNVTNQISLTTAGLPFNGLNINASGNVGIGITNASSALNVIGNVGIGTSAAGSTLSVNGNGIFGWGTASVVGPSNGLAVFGNVGIGTSSPAAHLEITKSNPELRLTDTGSSLYSRITKTNTSNKLFLYNKVSVPGTSATLDLQVGLGSDNSTRYAGAFYINGNHLDVGWVNERVKNGLRFTNATIPQGATINVAYITFTARYSGNGGFTVNVYGEDTDDSSTFSTGADFDGRTWTTAYSQWISGAWTPDVAYNSPSIVSAIQEVVDRAGWVSGNDMSILIDAPTGSGTQYHNPWAYTGDSTKAAKLHIEYTPAATNQEVTVVTSEDGGTGEEYGIQTFGDASGRTVLQGATQRFFIGSSEKMRLDASGNLGIGTSAAGSSLAVAGNGIFGWGTTSVAGPANGLAVFGNVGIGTTSPTNPLTVIGNANVTGTLTTGGLTNTGTFLAANGTASAPSYSFTNLTNAGLWTNGDGLLLTTGGTNTSGITVTGAGYVGIGTTAPGTKLHIESADEEVFKITNGASDPLISLGSSGTDGLIKGGLNNDLIIRSLANAATEGIFFQNDSFDAGSPSNLMTILSSGNVGIGTTSPGNLLSIYGANVAYPTVYPDRGVASGQLQLASTDSWAINKGGSLAFSGTTDTTGQQQVFAEISGRKENSTITNQRGYLSFFTSGGNIYEKMRIDSNGNVGIGNTSPVQVFQVNNTTSSFVVTSGGNVGIGFTSPSTKLYVAGSGGLIQASGTANSDPEIQIIDAAGGAGRIGIAVAGHIATGALNNALVITNDQGALQFGTGTAAPSSVRMTIDTTGQVGIGTVSPSQIFQVNATGTSSFVVNSSGNVGIGTSTTGVPLTIRNLGTTAGTALVVDGSGQVYKTSSSLRYKDNIQDLNDNFAKILQVQPKSFNYKDTGAYDIGYIAEDFDSLGLKDLVIYDDQGRPDGIKYDRIGLYAIEVLKNQQSQLVLQGLSLSTQGETLNKISGALSVAGGNVGIGTTNPTSALDVVGNVNVSGSVKTPLLDLGPATIASSAGNLAIQFSSDTTLFQIKNSLGQNLFQIDASGSAKLSGTITTEAGAFDVAEDYLAKDDVEAGDVVSISSVILEGATRPIGSDSIATPSASLQNDNSMVEKSSKPYDNKVIGIISTKPGIKLAKSSSGVGPDSQGVLQGSNEVNIRPVALNGRVPVKVSTENGAINVGDFLTSSSIPGVAMRATKPGTVIGKALEGYNNPDPHQVDKIMMFINISFADPGNFLASLSLDDQGNMIIPKIRTSSLMLDPSVASASSQLTINNDQLTINSDPNYTSPGPNLASNTNSFIDLSGEIASLEDRIKSLEDKLASKGDALEAQQATPSAQIAGEATSSAVMLEEAQRPIASNSANLDSIATPSASLQNDITLNLTPPDILYNTGSAVFTNLTVKSEATISGQLAGYDLSVSNSFKSLGKTTLADTLIAGDLTIDGTMSISGNSINAIGVSQATSSGVGPDSPEVSSSGILYLQSSSLAQGLDIFNGKVTIDPTGNITTQGKIVAAEVKTNKLTISNTPIASSSGVSSGSPEVGAASIGTATLPNGSIAVTIDSAEISDSAKVFITPTSPTDKVLSVTNIKPGVSFDVATLTPAQADIKFNWWIVQTN